ncbi:hypothetical protein ACFL1B_06005 [Nanoarchaeota archaeon]
MPEPRIMDANEISDLTLTEVVERETLRDIHYTLQRVSKENNPFPSLYIQDNVISLKAVVLRVVFTLNDDPAHVYFFEEASVEDSLSYLDKNDLIASGMKTPDTRNWDSVQGLLGISNDEIASSMNKGDLYDGKTIAEHMGRVDVPFAHILHRMPVEGNSLEHYNSKDGRWELLAHRPIYKIASPEQAKEMAAQTIGGDHQASDFRAA